jgi:membrane-associated progesterone receptor component
MEQKMQNLEVSDKPGQVRYFTEEELRKYNGATESTPIYVAVKGKVYDISSKRDFYGPGSSYNAFAGRNATRALAKSSLNPADIDNSSIADLDKDEITTLNDWVMHYESKYPTAGYLIQSQEKSKI